MQQELSPHLATKIRSVTCKQVKYLVLAITQLLRYKTFLFQRNEGYHKYYIYCWNRKSMPHSQFPSTDSKIPWDPGANHAKHWWPQGKKDPNTHSEAGVWTGQSMVLREMHITSDNNLKCQGGCLLDGCLLPISREKSVYSIEGPLSASWDVKVWYSQRKNGRKRPLKLQRKVNFSTDEKTLFFFLPVSCFLSRNKRELPEKLGLELRDLGPVPCSVLWLAQP